MSGTALAPVAMLNFANRLFATVGLNLTLCGTTRLQPVLAGSSPSSRMTMGERP